MKSKAYLETTIVSYLTARPSRDLVVAAHQELTLEWWSEQRQRFDLFVSDFVLREAARGDESAAKRLSELDGIPVLELNEAARELARALVARRLIPENVVEDAFHIAIATVHGMDFLLTWNCRHIANAETAKGLKAFCEKLGHELPVLCTPEQLMGDRLELCRIPS